MDHETGEHNRHDDKSHGCDFAFSGGSFPHAFAFLHSKTGDPHHLDWARKIADRHWNARNPTTNLAPDAPSTGDRHDAHHCFTTVTGDPTALVAARNWAAEIRNALPPGMGRRWRKETTEALPSAEGAGGTYAENHGRAISFFLNLHQTTGDREDLDTALQLADEAIAKLHETGWFKGHPAKPYYEATDGVAYLLYALLELAVHPARLPVNL